MPGHFPHHLPICTGGNEVPIGALNPKNSLHETHPSTFVSGFRICCRTQRHVPAVTITSNPTLTSFITAITGNDNLATKQKTETITDSATGIVFTYTITWTGIGGTLMANGGTGTGEFGINGSGADNNAIDQTGEGVSYTVSNITITNYNGFDPGDVASPSSASIRWRSSSSPTPETPARSPTEPPTSGPGVVNSATE